MNVIAVALFLVGFPFCVYFSVKFGRFGYLRANEAFTEYQKNKQRTQTISHE